MSAAEEEWQPDESHRYDPWQHWAPRRYQDVEFAALDEEVKAPIKDWAKGLRSNTSGNLLLLGPLGVGKTHTAMAACREILRGGLSVRWWPVVELLEALRPGHEFRDEEGDECDLLDFIRYKAVVFLDDLGMERPSEWAAEQLYIIVNRRWLEQRPLIVTSNLTPNDLRDTIGARTYDRLRDGAAAIELSGESRRGQ